MRIELNAPADDDNFNEEDYLAANSDVAAAVRNGGFESGRQHFDTFGRNESRLLRRFREVENLRKAKIELLRPKLRADMPCDWSTGKPNYLSDELRALSGIVDTDLVSSHGYDGNAMALIDRYPDGLILDCGAGRRDTYFSNVVNFEIADYDTTDVLGVGEELPFIDSTFDAVLSLSVLEHVKDPFRCAREISRVLKPGGELYCAMPLLAPLHGYPHHYFNATHQGLRALFDPYLTITAQDVVGGTGPIFSLTWILQRWAAQLPDGARVEFEALTVADLIADPASFLDASWVKELPKQAQFELASGTVLFASKPAA